MPDQSLYTKRYCAKKRSILFHFYNVFGMMRSRIDPTTSRKRGGRSNTDTQLTYLICFKLRDEPQIGNLF